MAPGTPVAEIDLEVIDISLRGFLARSDQAMPVGARGQARVQLGADLVAVSIATVVRCVHGETGWFFGFCIDAPDLVWQACIADLEAQENPVGESRELTSFDNPDQAWPAYDTMPA